MLPFVVPQIAIKPMTLQGIVCPIFKQGDTFITYTSHCCTVSGRHLPAGTYTDCNRKSLLSLRCCRYLRQDTTLLVKAISVYIAYVNRHGFSRDAVLPYDIMFNGAPGFASPSLGDKYGPTPRYRVAVEGFIYICSGRLNFSSEQLPVTTWHDIFTMYVVFLFKTNTLRTIVNRTYRKQKKLLFCICLPCLTNIIRSYLPCSHVIAPINHGPGVRTTFFL